MRLYTRWLNLSQNLLLDVTNLRLFFSVQKLYFFKHTNGIFFCQACILLQTSQEKLLKQRTVKITEKKYPYANKYILRMVSVKKKNYGTVKVLDFNKYPCATAKNSKIMRSFSLSAQQINVPCSFLCVYLLWKIHFIYYFLSKMPEKNWSRDPVDICP